jgi:hypothetical protein
MRFPWMAAAVLALVATPVKAQSQPSTDILLKHCNEKTIVMGKDEKGNLVKVGEHLEGYCAGFLEGSLTMLNRAKGDLCERNSAHP